MSEIMPDPSESTEHNTNEDRIPIDRPEDDGLEYSDYLYRDDEDNMQTLTYAPSVPITEEEWQDCSKQNP